MSFYDHLLTSEFNAVSGLARIARRQTPEKQPPVTAAALTCTGAGTLPTLAMPPGKGAETFLDQQGFNYG